MSEALLHAKRFDELLVQLRAEKDPAYKRFIRKAIKVGSVAFMLLGAGFFSFFVWKFTSIFIINRPAELSFASFCGNFGDAAGGAINVMGLGGLIYSLLFVAEQVKGEKEARLQQDMPVVFVAPRLAWTLGGASDRKLLDKGLILHVGFRNTSDSAATHLVFNICELVYRPNPADAQAQNILRDEDKEKLIDNLPGQELTGGINGLDNYHVRIDVPLIQPQTDNRPQQNNCPGLLDAIFDQDSAKSVVPSLEMKFSVAFNTIRGAPFFGYGSAVWSPKDCRDVKDNKQSKFLNDFATARKKFEKGERGLDEFFQGAEKNPLVPTITVLKENEITPAKS